MAKKLPKTTVRHGHKVTKSGAIKVTTTKPAKGLFGKVVDKALKSRGM